MGIELKEKWETYLKQDEIIDKIKFMFKLKKIKLKNHSREQIIGVHGSLIKTKLLGMWNIKPENFPKTFIINFSEDSRIEALIISRQECENIPKDLKQKILLNFRFFMRELKAHLTEKDMDYI